MISPRKKKKKFSLESTNNRATAMGGSSSVG
jgi:hypothetical protein